MSRSSCLMQASRTWVAASAASSLTIFSVNTPSGPRASWTHNGVKRITASLPSSNFWTFGGRSNVRARRIPPLDGLKTMCWPERASTPSHTPTPQWNSEWPTFASCDLHSYRTVSRKLMSFNLHVDPCNLCQTVMPRPDDKHSPQHWGVPDHPRDNGMSCRDVGVKIMFKAKM